MSRVGSVEELYMVRVDGKFMHVLGPIEMARQCRQRRMSWMMSLE